MDKKTLPLIVVLIAIIIFYYPILEYFGFIEEPVEQPVEQQTEAADTGQQAASPLTTAPPPATAVVLSDSVVADLAVVADTVRHDSLFLFTDKYEIVMSSFGGGPLSMKLKEYNGRDSTMVEMIPSPQAVTPEARFAGGMFSTSQLNYQCSLLPGRYDITSEPLRVDYSFRSPRAARSSSVSSSIRISTTTTWC